MFDGYEGLSPSSSMFLRSHAEEIREYVPEYPETFRREDFPEHLDFTPVKMGKNGVAEKVDYEGYAYNWRLKEGAQEWLEEHGAPARVDWKLPCGHHAFSNIGGGELQCKTCEKVCDKSEVESR